MDIHRKIATFNNTNTLISLFLHKSNYIMNNTWTKNTFVLITISLILRRQISLKCTSFIANIKTGNKIHPWVVILVNPQFIEHFLTSLYSAAMIRAFPKNNNKKWSIRNAHLIIKGLSHVAVTGLLPFQNCEQQKVLWCKTGAQSSNTPSSHV